METLLSNYRTIGLEEMGKVKLMNRTDTKFVTTRQRLLQLLEMAQKDYFVQEIGGKSIMNYATTYYDTPRFDMFYVHQAGHANRQKMRVRTYVDSNLRFLEVKTKNNHKRTRKKRIAVDDFNKHSQDQMDFLAGTLKYDAATLSPSLANTFKRITLVNTSMTERLTIDTSLRFQSLVTGKERDMGDLVVVELKRDSLSPSPVLDILWHLRIHPCGFSKYCIGSSLTTDRLRVNRFKAKLIGVNKIVPGIFQR